MVTDDKKSDSKTADAAKEKAEAEAKAKEEAEKDEELRTRAGIPVPDLPVQSQLVNPLSVLFARPDQQSTADGNKRPVFNEETNNLMDIVYESGELTESITYKKRDIRNWQIGKFEFKEHLLTISSVPENEEFLALLATLPESERSDVFEFHPEVLGTLNVALDLNAPTLPKPNKSGVVAGRTLTSGDLKDQKATPGTPSSEDSGANNIFQPKK